MDVIQKLDQLPSHIDEITREQIVAIAEPLIGISSQDEMMEMAKETSRSLFADIEPNERIELINNLVGFFFIEASFLHLIVQMYRMYTQSA